MGRKVYTEAIEPVLYFFTVRKGDLQLKRKSLNFLLDYGT